MQRKIEKYVYVAVMVVLALSVFRNLRLARRASLRIQNAQGTLEVLESTNSQLIDDIASVKSQSYLEVQARNKLGMVKSGEQVVVMPDPELVKSLSFRKKQVRPEEIIEPNWKKWMRLFL